ncbi:MAG: glutathione binding-like protein, partial [Pararhizobium sp.]
ANRPKALAFLEILDRELEDRAFIAGDRYTIADITGVVSMDFMKPAKIEKPTHLTNVMRWYEAIKARPSTDA